MTKSEKEPNCLSAVCSIGLLSLAFISPLPMGGISAINTPTDSDNKPLIAPTETPQFITLDLIKLAAYAWPVLSFAHTNFFNETQAGWAAAIILGIGLCELAIVAHRSKSIN